MSVADHFDHIPDRACVRGYDSASARRQFNISLAIFGLLCVACAIVAVVRYDTGFEAPASATVSAPPAYAGHL